MRKLLMITSGVIAVPIAIFAFVTSLVALGILPSEQGATEPRPVMAQPTPTWKLSTPFTSAPTRSASPLPKTTATKSKPTTATTIKPKTITTQKPTVKATPRPTTATHKPNPSPTPTSEYFSNCSEMHKVYPKGVPSSSPAYRRALDRDHDGWACETN